MAIADVMKHAGFWLSAVATMLLLSEFSAESADFFSSKNGLASKIFSIKVADIQTDRQTDGQTERDTESQTHRHID